MDQPSIWTLIARKLAGEASSADLLELDNLLERDQLSQFTFDLTQTYWNQHPDTPLTEIEIEKGVERIVHAGAETPPVEDRVWKEWERSRRRARRRSRVAIGAALTLGVVLCLWMALKSSGTKEPGETVAKETQVQTRMGTRTSLLLPDGTTVWLNAGSILTYPASFDAPNREVNLDGEAYFDVVKDPQHPFIVHTSIMNIRVLGTSFDVKAYARDPDMETTLIRGSVEVTRKDAPGAPRIMLKPNEKLIFHNSNEMVGTVPVARAVPKINRLEVTTLQPYKTQDEVVETAWVHNRLEFRGDSFDDLSRKLERWYNVQIRFDSEELKAYRFYGSFEKETIVQALDDLKMTAKFNYKINGNDIEILPQG